MTEDTKHVPKQSGMEQGHEKVVLALLNFLHGHDIPFYKLFADGSKKGEHSTEERLSMLGWKLNAALANATKFRISSDRLSAALHKEKTKSEKYRIGRDRAYHELSKLLIHLEEDAVTSQTEKELREYLEEFALQILGSHEEERHA